MPASANLLPAGADALESERAEAAAIADKRSAKSGPSATAATLFVTAITIAHLIVAARAALVPDEAYYWLWSRSLAAGYFDHPPMTALWVAGGTRLFGDNAFAIRLFSVLSPALVSVVLYWTARTLFSQAAVAARAVIWFNVMVLIGLGAFLAGPDSPSVVFWSLATLALAKVLRTERPEWWLAVGLFAGLGGASKYTNLFFGLVVLLWLLADRPARKWLTTPWPYAGAALAVLAFLPVLLWNAEHGWASFKFQFGRIPVDRYGVDFLVEFIASQFALINPFIAILAGVAIVHLLRSRLASREIRFVAITVAPMAAYMLFHSLHSRVEGNWTAPVYPSLALLAAIAAEGVLPRWLGFVRRAVVPFGLLVAAAGLAMVAIPAEHLQARLAAKFSGWTQLTAEVDRQRAATGAKWVATTDYAAAAELAFLLRPLPVVQINERIRYAYEPKPSLPSGPAILVQPESETGDLSRCFAQVRRIATFTPTPPPPGASYTLSVVEGPLVDLLNQGCTP